MSRLGWGAAAACALATACGSDGSAAAPRTAGATASRTSDGRRRNGFTYYAAAQGMAPDVWDVSADEAGNVYVAAGDAVLAKRRGDAALPPLRRGERGHHAELRRGSDQDVPRRVRRRRRAGRGGLRAPGARHGRRRRSRLVARLGRRRRPRASTARSSRARGTCRSPGCRTSSAWITRRGPCSFGDATWEKGRRKVRQVLRIAVNHAAGTLQYGDVWMAGTHGTFNVLVANPAARGWNDLTLAVRRARPAHRGPASSCGSTTTRP